MLFVYGWYLIHLKLEFQDECSFVSLRDVDRALKVMMWFYWKGELLFALMDHKKNKRLKEIANIFDEEFERYKVNTTYNSAFEALKKGEVHD